ncbi:MAG: hypothetical protein M1826_006512 [Phylliscum demangeonii]|nr:MAG: hypothetical protein M1826_006512 [Phylliscum demangeonii]
MIWKVGSWTSKTDEGEVAASKARKNSKRKKNQTKTKAAESAEPEKEEKTTVPEEADGEMAEAVEVGFADELRCGLSDRTTPIQEQSEASGEAKDRNGTEGEVKTRARTAADLEPEPTAKAGAARPENDALAHGPLTNGSTEKRLAAMGSDDIETRLEGLSVERKSLQAEVKHLRQSLEEMQEKHEKERETVRAERDEARAGKELAETQYRNLLGKLNTIRSQLGERLKADAEDLSRARVQIDELDTTNKHLTEKQAVVQAELDKLRQDDEQRSRELSSLRNRMNLSQQNWLREREDLVEREHAAKEEFEAAKQAMQDWEVLAMEERSIRESVTDKVAELDEQLSSQKEAYRRAAAERDHQSLTVEGLQRALQDLQDARKQELRDLVESSQSQIDSLRKALAERETKASAAETALEKAGKELERALPFESEVKEKNLLIGKLRHEAVILNDHLTKALRLLRKGKPEDNIDRQIVTNHFLHFLALDRADPKKFQVLQLIAALLNWTEAQREQAGLARPGAGNASGGGSLRAPLSPFHRTPSTPIMANFDVFSDGAGRKESLAELWSNFLEQETNDGSKAAGGGGGGSMPSATPSASSPPPSSG